MHRNRTSIVILFTIFSLLSYSVALADQIRAFVPGKPWEISIDVNGFNPWDVLQSKTILGADNGNGLIITIIVEQEGRPITPEEVLKKYWHYGPPGKHVTEFKNENMIIVSSNETNPILGKTFNGYVVKEDYSFDIHVSANLSKITKQEVIATIRSFHIALSPEKQAMDNLVYSLKSAKGEGRREQLLSAFTNKYQNNSWVFALLGELYFSTNKHNMAEKAYLKALENHRTQPMKNPVTLWLCYDGLGLIYGMSRQYEPAKKYFEKGYKCAERMLDDAKFAVSNYNLACLHAETKNYTTSVKYLRKAISLNPAYKAKAQTDSSFAGIRNQADFQNLVSE